MVDFLFTGKKVVGHFLSNDLSNEFFDLSVKLLLDELASMRGKELG